MSRINIKLVVCPVAFEKVMAYMQSFRPSAELYALWLDASSPNSKFTSEKVRFSDVLKWESGGELWREGDLPSQVELISGSLVEARFQDAHLLHREGGPARILFVTPDPFSRGFVLAPGEVERVHFKEHGRAHNLSGPATLRRSPSGYDIEAVFAVRGEVVDRVVFVPTEEAAEMVTMFRQFSGAGERVSVVPPSSVPTSWAGG